MRSPLTIAFFVNIIGLLVALGGTAILFLLQYGFSQKLNPTFSNYITWMIYAGWLSHLTIPLVNLVVINFAKRYAHARTILKSVAIFIGVALLAWTIYGRMHGFTVVAYLILVPYQAVVLAATVALFCVREPDRL
jgi:hypothetical protein